MSRVAQPETITRNEAIARLREQLVRLTDEDTCMCKVATDKKIFCRGFAPLSDATLRERYWWIVRRRPDISRAELELIANDWQLAQQEVREVPLACDVQTKAQDTCRGWLDFDNEQLAQFYNELTGKQVRIS